MFKLGRFQKNSTTLADLLPWAALVAPGVVLNKDGSLQRSCSFRGPDLESASDEQMMTAMARLNNVLKRLGSGWAMYIEAKRDTLSLPLPSHVVQNKIALLIDVEHHQRFNKNTTNFQSHYYLTLQYLPKTAVQRSLWHNFINDAHTLQNDEEKYLQEFIEQTQAIFNILSELCFEARFLSDAETLTYLHRTISSKDHPVNPPEVPIYLDALLADTPLVGGLEPQLGERYLKTITIIGFPALSVPAILDRLNALSFSYRWVTRFIPLDKLEAEQRLKRHRQRWFAKRKNVLNLVQEVFTKQESALLDQTAIEKSKEVDEALQTLANDSVSYGYFTCTISLQHEDKAILLQNTQEVERVINGLGFTTIVESINAVEAWLSSIPGQAYANVRKSLLHTLNLAHLIPFSAIWCGQEKDAHLKAAPLFYAYTHGNTPFRFALHLGDVGHLMIIGPTGAGKSVLLNFIAWQFCRYAKSRVVIFDKGHSFLASTLAAQGVFYELGKPHSLHFQPLAHINQEHEMTWAAEWLQEILTHENVHITPDMKQEIWHALQSLLHLPQRQRTLSSLVALLQDHALRQAFQPYTLTGSFGALFDADQESLQRSHWLCFEMEALMNMPAIIAPALSYLFHRLEQNFTGDPSLLILDEAWLFLNHPVFVNKIRDWLKSLRKKNVSVIFATQSVSDAAHHAIAATLLESCPARIFLPNDRALEPQIKNDYLQIGLNEKQLMLLTEATPKHHYYYQSRLGCSLFSLALGPLALAFCGASTPSDIQFIQEALHLDYFDFMQRYLNFKQVAWAAEFLQTGNSHEALL